MLLLVSTLETKSRSSYCGHCYIQDMTPFVAPCPAKDEECCNNSQYAQSGGGQANCTQCKISSRYGCLEYSIVILLTIALQLASYHFNHWSKYLWVTVPRTGKRSIICPPFKKSNNALQCHLTLYLGFFNCFGSFRPFYLWNILKKLIPLVKLIYNSPWNWMFC